MGTDWSFGDELEIDLPFAPGKAYCHHCGAAAPEGIPGSDLRCTVCHAHLHTCRNCMFDHGMGCLLLSPHRTPTSGVPGQYGPTFVWRDEDTAAGLDRDSVAALRR